MASSAGVQSGSFHGLTKVVLAIIGLLAVYYIFSSVLGYYVWNEESYGYYWQYRISLIFHVTGGLAALTAGVFQLWTGLNRTGMKQHPMVGKLYVAGVAVGALGGAVLSVTSAVYGLTFGVALFCLSVSWVAITAMAVHCIWNRNVRLHKQWMIRSYILTFGFVTFRLVLDFLPYEQWWGVTREDMANATIWLVWVMPMIAYEIRAQLREV